MGIPDLRTLMVVLHFQINPLRRGNVRRLQFYPIRQHTVLFDIDSKLFFPKKKPFLRVLVVDLVVVAHSILPRSNLQFELRQTVGLLNQIKLFA